MAHGSQPRGQFFPLCKIANWTGAAIYWKLAKAHPAGDRITTIFNYEISISSKTSVHFG